MIIDCISDLHGEFPQLEGGDLLIVGGDWCFNDSENNLRQFEGWLLSNGSAKYNKTVVIAGNHDNAACEFKKYGLTPYLQELPSITYLCDSGTTVEHLEYICDSVLGPEEPIYIKKRLKIWGSPWTKTFPGINPHCCAFTVDTDEELAQKWALIPDDIDILVTHCPPLGILDFAKRNGHVGSKSLSEKARSLPNLKLFVWGHIHEAYGKITPEQLKLYYHEFKLTRGLPLCASFPFLVNASHMNEVYDPVNKPVRIIL